MASTHVDGNVASYSQAQAARLKEALLADRLDDVGELVELTPDGVTEKIAGQLFNIWIDPHSCPLCAFVPTLCLPHRYRSRLRQSQSHLAQLSCQ
jgi:hypothetical protein